MGLALVQRVECSCCQIVVNSLAFAPLPRRCRIGFAPQTNTLLACLVFGVHTASGQNWTGLFGISCSATPGPH